MEVGAAERRAAHGDLESPEPGWGAEQHRAQRARLQRGGISSRGTGASRLHWGRKRRRAAALQMEQPGYNILTTES